MKKALFSLLAFYLAACAPQNSNNAANTLQNSGAIVGGDKVESKSAVGRSTVGIYETKIGYICSGTLIAPNLVLTAAHCVDPKAEDLKIIFAPEMKKAPKELIRNVNKAIVHEQYKEDVQANDMNDIAVLRFDGEAPTGFQAAPMLFQPGYLQNKIKTIVAGYGLSWTVLVSGGSGTLRTTKLPIDDVNFSQTEVMLGQSLRRGICSGDSGGPAYLEINGQLYVWGVASRGDSLPIWLVPKCMLFSVFTRVDSHQHFIEDAMTQLRQ